MENTTTHHIIYQNCAKLNTTHTPITISQSSFSEHGHKNDAFCQISSSVQITYSPAPNLNTNYVIITQTHIHPYHDTVTQISRPIKIPNFPYKNFTIVNRNKQQIFDRAQFSIYLYWWILLRVRLLCKTQNWTWCWMDVSL